VLRERYNGNYVSTIAKYPILKMLDLEVIPERSLGCEHWEFILGKA
jgi:hypothetical protein